MTIMTETQQTTHYNNDNNDRNTFLENEFKRTTMTIIAKIVHIFTQSKHYNNAIMTIVTETH